MHLRPCTRVHPLTCTVRPTPDLSTPRTPYLSVSVSVSASAWVFPVAGSAGMCYQSRRCANCHERAAASSALTALSKCPSLAASA